MFLGPAVLRLVGDLEGRGLYKQLKISQRFLDTVSGKSGCFRVVSWPRMRGGGNGGEWRGHKSPTQGGVRSGERRSAVKAVLVNGPPVVTTAFPLGQRGILSP